jgi:hypothetical protein
VLDRARRIDKLRERLADPLARRIVDVAVACVWVAGVVVRFLYVLRIHHPRHYVLTDARQLTDLAMRLVGSPAHQAIYDTIWPPGAPAIVARLAAGDPTLGRVALLQFLLSSALPLVVAHTAFLIAGRGVALIALAIASLHFGFIYGAGFFLSETFFQFAMALAIWGATAALLLDARVDERFRARGAALVRAAMGVVVGVLWALATSFRPNALPVAAGVGVVLTIHWLRRARARSCWLLVGGAVGLMAALAPLSDRCSTLAGRSCVVAANAAMNVALGQVDDMAGIEFFDPAHPELNSWWMPPGLLQHGYQGVLRVPHSIWDSGGIARWVVARAWHDPGRFVIRTLRNVVDIFRVAFWPPDLGPWPAWPQLLSGWLFLAVVVLPVLISLPGLARAAFRRDQTSPWPAFLGGTVVAVVLVAAASIGEPRYRFPFDGALIIVAAARFAGVTLALRPASARSRPAIVGGLAAAGAVAVAAVAAIVAACRPRSAGPPTSSGRWPPEAPGTPAATTSSVAARIAPSCASPSGR